jgi:hypothetical protein
LVISSSAWVASLIISISPTERHDEIEFIGILKGEFERDDEGVVH